MNITQLPFNQFIGIEKCENKTDGIFQLPTDPKYLNHVDTVHASALYALGEASSGEFLAQNTKLDKESITPILRRADIKYRKLAIGQVYTKGIYKEEDWVKFHEFYRKKKIALIAFQIDILNEKKLLSRQLIMNGLSQKISSK